MLQTIIHNLQHSGPTWQKHLNPQPNKELSPSFLGCLNLSKIYLFIAKHFSLQPVSWQGEFKAFSCMGLQDLLQRIHYSTFLMLQFFMVIPAYGACYNSDIRQESIVDVLYNLHIHSVHAIFSTHWFWLAASNHCTAKFKNKATTTTKINVTLFGQKETKAKMVAHTIETKYRCLWKLTSR